MFSIKWIINTPTYAAFPIHHYLYDYLICWYASQLASPGSCSLIFFFFFLRDFIFKKTLFEKLQYLKQEQYNLSRKRWLLNWLLFCCPLDVWEEFVIVPPPHWFSGHRFLTTGFVCVLTCCCGVCFCGGDNWGGMMADLSSHVTITINHTHQREKFPP